MKGLCVIRNEKQKNHGNRIKGLLRSLWVYYIFLSQVIQILCFDLEYLMVDWLTYVQNRLLLCINKIYYLCKIYIALFQFCTSVPYNNLTINNIT